MIFATKGYIEFCEGQIKQQREDFLERLREKDSEIRRLRAELAGRARIEPEPLQPYQRVQKAVVDHIENGGPLDWQGELSTLLHEEEAKDGV